MRSIITASIIAALSGCAAQSPYPTDPVTARCEYQAEVAIQSISNPLYAGVRKGELMSLCLRGAGR